LVRPVDRRGDLVLEKKQEPKEQPGLSRPQRALFAEKKIVPENK